jgi:hypothetical protein
MIEAAMVVAKHGGKGAGLSAALGAVGIRFAVPPHALGAA